MDAFDRDAESFNRLCARGDIGDALKRCLTVCQHSRREAAAEAPNLRDARADLLTKAVLLAQTVQGLDGDLDRQLYALLERRVFNWVGTERELDLFGPLDIQGFDAFDNGYDHKVPVPLCDFCALIERAAESETKPARCAWLQDRGGRMCREAWSRVRAVLDDQPLRVGARVVTRGLKDVRYNGLKGTLTRRQGSRWGVIFDDSCETRAVRPESLATKTAEWRFRALPSSGSANAHAGRTSGGSQEDDVRAYCAKYACAGA